MASDDGPKQMPLIDPEEAENRMLTRIERLEKWEKQRQASKYYHQHPSNLISLFAIELFVAQQKTELDRINAEEATFKPKTNKTIKKDQMDHFNVGQGAAGM